MRTLEDFLNEQDRPVRIHEAWKAVKYAFAYEFEKLLVKMHIIKERKLKKPELDIVELRALQRKIGLAESLKIQSTNKKAQDDLDAEIARMKKRYGEIKGMI